MTTHTRDLDDAFFAALNAVSRRLGANPIHLLSVMMSESGVRADAHNPNGHASGLIQFMPATLVGLGWQDGHEAFRRLSATRQLPFVEKYFHHHRGKLGSVGAIYVATFLPALLDHAGDPGFVLTAKGGPLGWAYAPNAVLDENRDLKITVGELERAVARNCRGPRWAEILVRLERETPDVDHAIDLHTTIGLQRALAHLGYDVGAIDGVPGVRTRSALIKFQADRGLKADGTYGPITRAALENALKSALKAAGPSRPRRRPTSLRARVR